MSEATFGVDHSDALRTLLLQWLLVMSTFETGDGQYWYKVLNRSPEDDAWLPCPPGNQFPDPSFRGHRLSNAEYQDAIGSMERDGLVWIRYVPRAVFPGVNKEMQLTGSGYGTAAESSYCQVPTERLRCIRSGFMRWLGDTRGKSAWTAGGHRVSGFLHADVQGMPVAFFELFAAIRLLEIEGLVSLEYSASPGVHVVYPRSTIQAELTRAGLICVEEYSGDIWKMREAQRRGDDNRVYVGSAANIAVHSSDIIQSADHVVNVSAELQEIRKIAEFAITHSGELGLSSKGVLEIGNIIEKADVISSDPGPDDSKLRELGHSLRRALEGAAGNILADIILKHCGL